MDFLFERHHSIRSIFFLSVIFLSIGSCRERAGQIPLTEDVPFNGEAISLLGDTLHGPSEDVDDYKLKDSMLQQAYAAYLIDSNDLDNIIWVGRRLAYLHRYKESIAVYTRGIDLYPEAPQLYRHRGHRLITIRKLDEAIADLIKGSSLMKGERPQPEADGIPNKLNIPLSNLHFNLYYHLGLAYYLKGDYDKAISSYRDCMKYSDNPDLIVATTDWLWLSHMRRGDTIAAGELLVPIHAHMEIIENNDYHRRLLMYKGIINPDTFLDTLTGQISLITQSYGLACLMEFKGRQSEAASLRRKIIESSFWPAFSFMAAEADSSRILIH